MSITVSNFFDYYSTLSKKKRLDSREARVRSREMSISRSVPAAPAPVVDQESKFIEAQKGDVDYTSASLKTLKKLINYKPKVNLDSGIKKFAKWFIEKK